MGKRGPGANKLQVVREDESASLSRLPGPPDRLSPRAAEIWRSCVGTKPSDWFSDDALPLLESYCRHCASAEYLSDRIAAYEESGEAINELDDFNKLLAAREREYRAAEAKARSLRLTNQSKWQPATAARKASGAGQSKRPWES
jgi:hypothetical protein